MQQLKTVLVGLSGNLLSPVEGELRDFGAIVAASFLNVEAALATYRIPQTEKCLFVVELHGPDDIPLLSHLTDNFPGHPVLALSQAQDAATLLGAMRAGATQFVPLPMKAAELREALDRSSRQFGLRPSAGRFIAVTGVTEGCGATTIALNLASEANRLGAEQTLLIELGSRLGRLAVMLGVNPKYTTADLLDDINEIDMNGFRKAATPVREGLSVLPGAYQAISMSTPPVSAVLRLLAMARRTANLVVLDLAGSFDEVYFGVLSAVDDVVFVAEQKVPSVHSLMLLRDSLVSRGIHARPFHVINRYSEDMPGATLSEIRSLLPAAPLYPVRSDGRGVMESINLGKPLRDAAPNSPVLEDLGHLMEGIASGPIGAPRLPAHPNWLTRGLGMLFGR